MTATRGAPRRHTLKTRTGREYTEIENSGSAQGDRIIATLNPESVTLC